MRKPWKKFCLAAMLLIGVSVTVPAAAQQARYASGFEEKDETAQEPDCQKGEAIILYREPSAIQKRAGGFDSDISVVETYEFDGADVTSFGLKADAKAAAGFQVSLVRSDSCSTEELIARLEKKAGVLIAEPNFRIHILKEGGDPYEKYQWAIENRGQNFGTVGYGIHPDQSALLQNTQTECVIALLDTGIDYTHEDLKDIVWNNPIRSDQLRGWHGYDFISYDEDPMDDNGHGSHCSGIMAAAAGNGVGIRGVAAGDNIKIMALKILDETGDGFGMEAVGAYHYIYKAQQLGVRVAAVNNSWTSVDGEKSKILAMLIEMVGENGAISVCAAGNEAVDNDIVASYPACIDSDYVISVAASNENDEIASFSNYGADSVDLAAPGADILSTVPYDCFNPGIYENKDELCSIYEDFSDTALVPDGRLGEHTTGYGFVGGSAGQSLTLSEETGFGLETEPRRSLQWKILSADEGALYTLYLPYTANPSSTGVYASVMAKASALYSQEHTDSAAGSLVYVNHVRLRDDGGIDELTPTDLVFGAFGGFHVDKGNYWHHINGQVLTSVAEAQDYALAITLVTASAGDYEICLDNLGISKANVAAAQFGKYDYNNGTSMATPFVTGAAAAIAAAYPNEDTLTCIGRLLGCTRDSAAWAGRTKTGGVLDLSLVETPKAALRDIFFDGEQNICILGTYLETAEVTINGQKCMPKEQSAERILLDASGLLDHPLEITVTAGDRTFSKTCFFSEGAPYTEAGATDSGLFAVSAVSDGERLYGIDKNGIVSTLYLEDTLENGSYYWSEGDYAYTPEIFGENSSIVTAYTITNLSDVIFFDGKIWTVLHLDMKYAGESVLACYDPDIGWEQASELPKVFEKADGISIAAYQGYLYLLGGLDQTTGAVLTDAARMDPRTGIWESVTELPKARAFAQAVQAEGRLVVMLGTDGGEECPDMLCYDGSKWTTAEPPASAVQNGTYSYSNSEGETVIVRYYDGRIYPVKGGLICTGLQAKDLGDTFFCRLDADSVLYVPSGYSICNTWTGTDSFLTVGVRDQLYMMAQQGEDLWNYTMCLFTIPVESVCVEVSAPGTENGMMEGGFLKGIRPYLPGDVITITADTEEGYFIKELLVNGEAVEADESGEFCYRAIADSTEGIITAYLEIGAYVWEIMMMENEIQLSPGKTHQLEAYIMPENAENQKLIWSSDNPDIVSVNQKGRLTASKKAKEGDTAVITAASADRGTVMASCLVHIAAKEPPAKNTLHTTGGLQYKVTKSAEKAGTVTCMGFSGKSAKSVKIPASVKIDGYTFQVTAIAKNAFAKDKKLKNVQIGTNITIIGKNAFYNCGKLQSVTIKGTSIKTFGAKAFNGIHKKAVIHVPKNCKKKYTSKLNQAGYQGSIK